MQNYSVFSPEQAAGAAIDILAHARQAVLEVISVRKKNKLSSSRSANVAKEIQDLIRVLKYEMAN